MINADKYCWMFVLFVQHCLAICPAHSVSCVEACVVLPSVVTPTTYRIIPLHTVFSWAWLHVCGHWNCQSMVTLWMRWCTEHPDKVTDSMKQSFRNWKSLSWSSSPSVRHPECLLACSKDPASGTYHQEN